MQLLCNGVFLDLYEDTNVQFMHDNPLFAFDDLKCERTTQIKIPTTPKNDKLLALARIPAYRGDGMRRKLAAQLQAGEVVKDGYLYVSDFDGKDYNTIFVTGDFIGLQAIRDAGKVQDIIGDEGIIARWDIPRPGGSLTEFDVAGYQKNYGVRSVPSVTLKYLIQTAMQNIGATVPYISDSYRIIPKTPKTASGVLNYNNTFNQSWQSSYSTTNILNTITLANSGSAAAVLGRSRYKIRYRATRTPNYLYGHIEQLISRTHDIRITFPSNLPNSYFLLSFPATAAEDPHDDPEVYKEEGIYEIGCTVGVFLGDYSFNINWSTATKTAVGTPLAGRTVMIPRGVPFVLLDWSSFWVYTTGEEGWYEPYESGVTLELNLEQENAAPDSYIPLYGNMPDVTLVDLLKTYAALTGTVLNYDSGGVSFDNLNLSTWQTVNLSGKITKRGKVTRTFNDYAQQNIISFKWDDTQFQSDKITRTYAVDNDNLERINDLQVIPFSEGSKIDGNDNLLIRNSEEQEAPVEFTIGQTHGDLKLHRVYLPGNNGLIALCGQSTQYNLTFRITLLEYDRITPKTLIYVDGTRYVWTSRNWQNNEAQFTLAKIP